MPPKVSAFGNNDYISGATRTDAGVKITLPPGLSRLHELRLASVRQGPALATIHEVDDDAAPDGHTFLRDLRYSDSNASPLSSVASLHASIQQQLSAIKAEWQVMQKTISPDAIRQQLSGEYDDITRLSEAIVALGGDDPLGIEAIASKQRSAIEKLCRSSDKPWRSAKHRSLHTHLSQIAPEKRSKQANAAFDVLQHLNAALSLMSMAMSVKRGANERREALKDPALPPEEREQLRAQLDISIQIACEQLSHLEPLINRELTQAEAAIPKERQRTAKKIGLILVAALVTLCLGLAVIAIGTYAPPALAGLALAVKILLTFTSTSITAGAGIYAVIGYKRPSGWDELAKVCTRVRNMNNSINAGFEARNGMLHANQILELDSRLDSAGQQIVEAKQTQATIDRKLKRISTSISPPPPLR